MVSVGVCNQQFQGTDYTFNGLWLPGCRKALLCKHMTRFLLVRFLLVCYTSSIFTWTKNPPGFQKQNQKNKKIHQILSLFLFWLFPIVFKCARDFSKCFFINKDQPPKTTPRPSSSPRFVSLTKKSGLAKGGYSKAPSPNQRASCNPWLVFSFPSKTHYFW